MVLSETNVLRHAFNTYEYNEENEWMKKYIDDIFKQMSMGFVNFVGAIGDYETKLSGNNMTDLLSFMIKTCIQQFGTVYIGKKRFRITYSHNRGIMKYLLYSFTKPFEFSEEGDISYEMYQERAYRYGAIQDMISSVYMFGHTKISSFILKKGYKPKDDFIIYLVYTKQYQFLDFLLTYHPVNSQGCVRIYNEILKSANEAMEQSNDKEKYETLIKDAMGYFM
jgi:hypothetical protein